ncbi:MAG: dependent oxidoreductase [Acidobacteriaceae bacterium]|nr:dependent oxidoreductase [Acidobacteriaceae bacterium]
MHHSDYCIAGAGIIGLSLALELHRRGATVTVLERNAPLAEASYAAGGMLASHDPENPAALQPLADLSLSLYPAYLAAIESLSQLHVPFQTYLTLQSHPTSTPADTKSLLPQLNPGSHTFVRLKERSIDPRQLGQALLAAVLSTSIALHPHTPVQSIRSVGDAIEIQTTTSTFSASHFIDCTGAWAAASSNLPSGTVVPRKGQMLAVALPSSLPLDLVIRTPEIYIIPRTQGPNAGHVVIGATVEDKGFDKTVHPIDIAMLQSSAAELLPQLADATILETWAGLRPATSDLLPLLGALPHRPRHLLAAGHYRNGILLAPATAHLMAQLLTNETPAIDVAAFAPARIAGLLST